MVSLTSLLVLTGLLTQTSQSIPKTAYLKLIDVWYITFIFFNFMIIVVVAVIESLCQRAKLTEVKVIEKVAEGRLQKAQFAWLPQTGDSLARKVNSVSIVAFPIACAIILVLFACHVALELS